MLTDYCFYTTQVFQAERTEDRRTPAGRSHWLEPRARERTMTVTLHQLQGTWTAEGFQV